MAAGPALTWRHVQRAADEDHKARRADDSFDICRSCGQRIEKMPRGTSAL